MRILFLGDIIGLSGCEVIIQNLPKLIKKNKIDYDDKSNINDLLMSFTKIKREFRSEKMLMYFVLYFIYFRSNHNLENIIFI